MNAHPAPSPAVDRSVPSSPSLSAPRVWRRDVVGLCVVALAGLCVFHVQVARPTSLLTGVQHGGRNDLTAEFLSFLSLPSLMAARSGEWPWWNPYMLGGTPHFGNPQSAMFYPPNWLTRSLPAEHVAGWLLVTHHVWGGWGAYCLARRWGWTRLAATFAGSCVVGAPYFVAQTGEGHLNQIAVTAWAPWTWLAWESLAAGRRGGRAATVATLALGFFAGHVQEWFYLTLLLGAVACWEAVRRWRTGDRPAAFRVVRDTGLAFVLTAAVVSIEFVPAYLYTTQTVRGGKMSAAAAGEISLGAASLRQLLDPTALGGPDAYQGPGRFYWETLFHFGVVTTILALAAAIWRRGESRIRLLAVLAVASAAFAFGDGSPAFHLAHAAIPGVAMFRAPSRALFFTSYLVALLAAALVDRLVRGDAARGAEHESSDASRTAPPATWRPAVALFLIVLVAAEEARHAARILDTTRTTGRDPLRMLEGVGWEPGDRVLADQSLLSDREAAQADLVKLQGYEPIPLVRQVALADALAPEQDPATILLGFRSLDLTQLDARVAAAAGVRWAVTAPQKNSPPKNWRRVARFDAYPDEFQTGLGQVTQRPCEVYENVESLPRAFVVGEAQEATGREAGRRLAEIDPRRTVLLTSNVLTASAGERRASFRPAKVLERGAARLIVEAELDAPGYLVVQDTWAPGWKATVDGRPAPVLPANVAARAVPLEVGSHRVEFAYAAPGWSLGWMTCVGGLVALVVWSRASGARPRRTGVSSPSDAGREA